MWRILLLIAAVPLAFAVSRPFRTAFAEDFDDGHGNARQRGTPDYWLDVRMGGAGAAAGALLAALLILYLLGIVALPR